MKIVMVVGLLIMALNACSGKSGVSDKEYQRSNSASEKSIHKLDRE
jgi:hypothetical protein